MGNQPWLLNDQRQRRWLSVVVWNDDFVDGNGVVADAESKKFPSLISLQIQNCTEKSFSLLPDTPDQIFPKAR